MTKSLFIFFLLSLSLSLSAQNSLVGKRYSNGGICSTNIRFVNDSLYSSNHGCESSGTTTIGLYELKKDTVLLKQFSTKLIELIKIDSGIIKDREDVVHVKIFDQNGINITKDVQLRSIHNDGRQFKLNYNSTLECGVIRRNCTEEYITCTTYNKANQDELVLNCSSNNSFIIHLKLDEIINDLNFKWHAINPNQMSQKFIINDKKLTELPSPMNMYLDGRNPDYLLIDIFIWKIQVL